MQRTKAQKTADKLRRTTGSPQSRWAQSTDTDIDGDEGALLC